MGYDDVKSDAAQRGQLVNCIRFGTWNVGSLSGRSGELVEVLARRKIDFCCIQETRRKGGSARWLGSHGMRYKLFWKGKEDGNAGVGILVAEKWVENIVSIDRISERILIVKLLIDKRLAHVVSMYAPQTGRCDTEKDEFWDKATLILGKIPMQDLLLVGGDLNGHVGNSANGFEGVHGGFGYGARNNDGVRILEFADSLSLVLCNTYFKKDPKYYILLHLVVTSL